MSIIAAKAIIGRELAAKLSQAVLHVTGARQALNPQNIIVADQFDSVTFLQAKFPDQLYWKVHRPGVAPSHDFHPNPPRHHQRCKSYMPLNVRESLVNTTNFLVLVARPDTKCGKSLRESDRSGNSLDK